MHSKQALAILALAACTATPVLSVPLADNQEQARAELEARLTPNEDINWGAISIGNTIANNPRNFINGGNNPNSPSPPSLHVRADSPSEDINWGAIGNTIGNNPRNFIPEGLAGVAERDVAARGDTLNQVD